MNDPRAALGENIRKARKRLDLTQIDLAQAIGARHAETISQIEKGAREVKAWELQRIANRLHVDYQELLHPQGPQYGPAPLWRKEPATDKLEIEALLRLRSRRYRMVMEMTGRTLQEDLPSINGLDLNAAEYAEVRGWAGVIRQRMDLGPRPARQLFQRLEERYGVMIFSQDLGRKGSAVSVRGPHGPAMLLNMVEPPWRRNYSCAHELFHLLTWDTVPRDELDRDPHLLIRSHKLADVFASALLLPEGTLREKLPAPDAGQVSLLQLIDLARDFGVSTDALLWRLYNLSLIKIKPPDLPADGPFRRADRRTMHDNWWTPKQLPTRFVELAFVAHIQGNLSRARLAEWLETNLADLAALLTTHYGLDLELDAAYVAHSAHP